MLIHFYRHLMIHFSQFLWLRFIRWPKRLIPTRHTQTWIIPIMASISTLFPSNFLRIGTRKSNVKHQGKRPKMAGRFLCCKLQQMGPLLKRTAKRNGLLTPTIYRHNRNTRNIDGVARLGHFFIPKKKKKKNSNHFLWFGKEPRRRMSSVVMATLVSGCIISINRPIQLCFN